IAATMLAKLSSSRIRSAVGVIASHWQQEVGVPGAPPSFLGPQVQTATQDALTQSSGGQPWWLDITSVDPLAPKYAQWQQRAENIQVSEPMRAQTLPLGGDRLGRDVLAKAIKGSEVSIFVGVFAAAVATVIGTLLGALAGYVGGRVGDFLEWLYNVFTSIPDILLIFAFAAVFGRGMSTVVLILALVGWTGMYRQVRAEYMKHRTREYVRAAEAIGVSHVQRMFVHILPNISHVVLVRMSILVVGFIKAEVILSFLGLGVPVTAVSWGTMLSEAQGELVRGLWWQLAAATAFMAVFVTAFALLTDALRDALDPKLKAQA
ncbi:MAG TPA: ABC transporter permease, partial [Burkholderiaceae bacterium]|nr:ABC transporter permease [Burkholderiaceae bacterium]